MYVAAGVVGVVYLVLGFLARGEQLGSAGKNSSAVLRPFYRIACYLCRRISVHKVSYSARGQVGKDLESLYPGEKREALLAEYYESKLAKSLMLVMAGTLLGWILKTDDYGLYLWMGAIGVAFLIYLLADKDLHDEVEKRKKQMKKDYPDIVHKLVLYLGAGMTIRSSFQRMADEYVRLRAAGSEKRPIYEEVLHTCRELKAGVSEGAAYEHFGKRTGIQEYIRLMTFLTQNLKKGNYMLLQRLREDATKASLERIQYGRRLGEEAVTKLLLPMVMMLLVVMLMIMIPAFASVGA